MPTISVPQSLLAELMANHGYDHDIADLEQRLPLMGTDIDACTATQLDIEIFPDRPDLLSGETLAFAMRPFLHGAPSSPDFPSTPSGLTFTVDQALVDVRPVMLAAVVRGVTLPSNAEDREAFIKALMDHQEKLHFALGRGRKRASIGVHDLANLNPPFHARAVPRSTSFVPLGETEAMTIDDILEHHPKGQDYAHLLDGMDLVPLIEDSHGDVLSFPPIINGAHTTVTHTTEDFFIDVTGWDPRACEAALMLVCLQLQERGGSVESVDITTCEGSKLSMPRAEAMRHRIPEGLVEHLLGRALDDAELERALTRMGGRLAGREPVGDDAPERRMSMAQAALGESWLLVDMPRWRFDMLHPVDVVEDIAIGHGYEDLGADWPKAQLTAVARPDHHLRRRLRETLQGMGFLQIQSLTLSNMEDQFERMRWTPQHAVTQLTNPITVDHTVLRQHLLPGLVRLLAANKHHDLPQRVYELGTVVRNHRNCNRLAMLSAERSGGFSAVRGRIQAFCRDMGITEWSVEPMAEGDGPWLAGRGAKLIVSGTWVGCFGELDPHVSAEFDLNVPLNGAELDVDALLGIIQDPV